MLTCARPRAFKIKINEWGWRINKRSAPVSSTSQKREIAQKASGVSPRSQTLIRGRSPEDDLELFNAHHEELHHAVKSGNHQELQRLLCLAPLNVDIRDREGETALYTAVKSVAPRIAKKAMVNILLDYGANMNAENSSGDTPFLGLIRGGCIFDGVDLLHRFISHGADMSLLDPGSGKSALELFLEESPWRFANSASGMFQTVTAFLDRGANPDSKVKEHHLLCWLLDVNPWAAPDDNWQKLILRLCKAKVSPLRQCGLPLHHLLRSEASMTEDSRQECLVALLKNGNDSNTLSNEGETTLDLAIYSEDIDTIRLMLALGVNPLLSNDKGNLPLYEAHILRQENNHTELDDKMFRILIDATIAASYAPCDPAISVSAETRSWWGGIRRAKAHRLSA